MLDGLNLLVSVSKFGIDTTKNRWYRIGIVSLVSLAHSSQFTLLERQRQLN